MNERTVISCVVALVVAALILATKNTDLIYIGGAFLFFVMCIGFAVWCERL